jgi:hypothetical protein
MSGTELSERFYQSLTSLSHCGTHDLRQGIER